MNDYIIQQLLIISTVLLSGMTIISIIAIITKNTSWVDLMWGLGITAVSWVLYSQYPGPVPAIATGLVSAWGLRLSGFLWFTRLKQGHRDRRYIAIEAKWHRFKAIRILGHFYMQALLQLPICFALLPLYLTPKAPLGIIQGVSLSLFFGALSLQWLADWQLVKFREKTKHKTTKSVCDTGLWGISRHPNYFFECLIWLSITLFSVGLPGHIWAWVSPLTIWTIVRYITGPYTEKLSLASRGDAFRAYQNRVPMIIPTKLFNQS